MNISKIRSQLAFLLLVIFLSSPYRVLGDTLETTGDVLQLAIPIYAFLYSLKKKDKEGVKEFLKSYSATISTTYTLKVAVHEKRPNGNDYYSFPSGHTASAFSGATYLYRRYHFTTFEKIQGILALLLAGVVGYSRIECNAHYPHDVVFGALLAISITSFFTSSKKNFLNLEVSPRFFYMPQYFYLSFQINLMPPP